jgi:hypothetical protein
MCFGIGGGGNMLKADVRKIIVQNTVLYVLLFLCLASCQKQQVLTKEDIKKEFFLFKEQKFNFTDLLKINDDIFLNPRNDSQPLSIKQILSYLKNRHKDASIYTRVIEFNKSPIICFRLQFIGSDFSDDFLDVGFCLIRDEKLLNNKIFQNADNPSMIVDRGIGLFPIEKEWYGFFHY